MELLPIPKAVALSLWPCNTQCPALLQADLPLVEGRYEWADGKSVSAYDSTVVAVHVDGGTQQVRSRNLGPTFCTERGVLSVARF